MIAGGLVGGKLRGGSAPVRARAVADSGQAALARSSGNELFDLSGGTNQIASLQERARLQPRDADVHAQLGIAYLQRARETNDPSYYVKADTLLKQAATLEPGNLDAILGQGSVALSRHEFRQALALGQRGAALTRKFSPSALAIIGDAQIELGRYAEAFATFDSLGSTRPGLVAYARQSYAQELQGNLDRAIYYMQLGVRAGSGSPENTEWTRIQLGGLLLKADRLADAQLEFEHALAVIPNYARAEAGLGAVAVARHQLGPAEKWYRQASLHLPAPDIVVSLGDVQTARGERTAAAQSYALVRAEQALFVAAGGNADMELALFDANHPPAGVSAATTVAHARHAVGERPSVYGHDALGWALYKAGDCQGALAEERAANALGTFDQNLSWHLGAAAACAGDKALARTSLRRALFGNPVFNPIDAPAARRLLRSLGGTA